MTPKVKNLYAYDGKVYVYHTNVYVYDLYVYDQKVYVYDQKVYVYDTDVYGYAYKKVYAYEREKCTLIEKKCTFMIFLYNHTVF